MCAKALGGEVVDCAAHGVLFLRLVRNASPSKSILTGTKSCLNTKNILE